MMTWKSGGHLATRLVAAAVPAPSSFVVFGKGPLGLAGARRLRPGAG